MGDESEDDRVYRTIIDRLVEACHKGQGQIGRKRALAGVWNANATAKRFPEQHEVNLLLGRLSKEDREVLARMLEEAFQGGVHSALATLHEAELPPFDKAYEGTPFHDFVGRLDDWEWPKSASRS
jgi:hypothetical protein